LVVASVFGYLARRRTSAACPRRPSCRAVVSDPR